MSKPRSSATTWEDALLSGALVLLVSIVAAFVMFGPGCLRPSGSGFQILATGLAGAASAVALRRYGWTAAFAAAILVLLALHVAAGASAYRKGWPGVLFVFFAGVSIVGGLFVHHITRRLTRFGRFVFTALLVGAGFVVAVAIVGALLRLPETTASMRINFAVGSLAGAAIGLGLEIAELVRNRIADA